MRWHPKDIAVTRVLVWRVVKLASGKWTWRVQSRNGRILVESHELFPSRLLAARGARMFGAPLMLQLPGRNRVTALHDGVTLVLNWSDK